MRILRTISLLMDYPTQALRDHRDELETSIRNSEEIGSQQKNGLLELLAKLSDGDILDVQEYYTELFDRGRSLSLLLFEHVHGESRDRGQAMVNLVGRYEAAGFVIEARELPDYLPLFLEYLSTRNDTEAREGLADVSHLIALLAARLRERESPYDSCFRALLRIAGEDPETAVGRVRDSVMTEARDDTLEALDKEWEEEVVNFLQAEQQGNCRNRSAYLSKADKAASALRN